jgi:hypothetical protein
MCCRSSQERLCINQRPLGYPAKTPNPPMNAAQTHRHLRRASRNLGPLVGNGRIDESAGMANRSNVNRDLGTASALFNPLEPSRLMESSIPTQNYRNRKRQIRGSLTGTMTSRSVQNPEHVIPPRQLEGPRCASRDESSKTRKAIFVALPSHTQGELPPLGCVIDVYEPVTSTRTVSPNGACRLGVVIARSVGHIGGSSG